MIGSHTQTSMIVLQHISLLSLLSLSLSLSLSLPLSLPLTSKLGLLGLLGLGLLGY